MRAEIIKITKEQANIFCYPENGTDEEWNTACAELGFDNKFLDEEEEIDYEGVCTHMYYFYKPETDKYFRIAYNSHECRDYDEPTQMEEVTRKRITKYVYEEIY
jgi:hypothetical protein